jgi:hypothetical protein
VRVHELPVDWTNASNTRADVVAGVEVGPQRPRVAGPTSSRSRSRVNRPTNSGTN